MQHSPSSSAIRQLAAWLMATFVALLAWGLDGRTVAQAGCGDYLLNHGPRSQAALAARLAGQGDGGQHLVLPGETPRQCEGLECSGHHLPPPVPVVIRSLERQECCLFAADLTPGSARRWIGIPDRFIVLVSETTRLFRPPRCSSRQDC